MKKVNRLKRNEDFNTIIKEGRKKMNSLFIVYYLPSLSSYISDFRIGISVGKKFGNAVYRNKQKRIVREIITQNNDVINKFDYVIISRPLCKKKSFADQTKAFNDIMRSIK